MVDIKKLKPGDILSEVSHYKVDSIYCSNVTLKHYESGETVTISDSYIEKFINSGDEFNEEIEVTKEDKKDGTLGIRSIFEGIHGGQVFTVCFKKQDKPRSKKAIEADMEERIESFIQAIDRAKAQKKSIAKVAKEHFSNLMLNPILGFEEGEERVLRGYKIQFESRDGRYNCVDMDIERTDKESGIRPVNINAIKYLIYNGVKYIVK